jgi:hypothetical protein
MGDKVFVDTNLWIYFFAKNPADKGNIIAQIITNQPSLVIINSTQVLGELYNVEKFREFSAIPNHFPWIDFVDVWHNRVILRRLLGRGAGTWEKFAKVVFYFVFLWWQPCRWLEGEGLRLYPQ